MQRHALVYSFVFAAIAITACGGSKGTGSDANGTADAGTECTTEGMNRCEGATYETCMGGNWNVTQQCTTACDPTLGCVACQPNNNYCVGEDVHSCTADGMDGGKQQTCTGTQICSGGLCVDPCADAANSRSYIGCEYWAVD